MSDRFTHVPQDDLRGRPKLSDEQIDKLEAENGLVQFDIMSRMIVEAVSGKPFKLTPDAIRELQAAAVNGLEVGVGEFRTTPVKIDGTAHVPPDAARIPALVDEMCAYVNERLSPAQAVRLAAYTMWRLNWIHPFSNGNGRTSRAVSYLVMCVLLGARLPGKRTVPELIAENKQPYYKALDAADLACKNGKVDVSVMEQILTDALKLQITEAIASQAIMQAGGGGGGGV